MKKVYMKPLIESMKSDLELQILKGSWNNHADSKEQQSFEEEEEEENLPDYVGAIKFRNVWDEDDN